MAPPKVYKNYINGEWVESVTGRGFDNVNPANTHELLGIFQQSSDQDVDDAVRGAKEAYKAWRLTPAP
jgi:aldehyde dehydrogenase (NAD+)